MRGSDIFKLSKKNAMFGLEGIADWWDTQRAESESFLQEWVNESRSDSGLYLRAGLATVVHTAMALGGGLVDVLRIGEGVRRGGTWGYVQDGLRLLTIAGPVARLGRLGMARWTFDPGGPLCASVATSRILRHTGTRLFMRASDIFQRTGGQPPLSLTEFIPFLRTIGARFQQIQSWQLSELPTLVQQAPRSVIMFGVRWRWPNTLDEVGHALYAYRDSLGTFRIADRTGRVVGSLQELNQLYPGIGTAVAQGEALLIHNSIITEGTTLLSILALEVNAILSRTTSEPHVVFSPSTSDR